MSNPVPLYDHLALGRRKLSTIFGSAPLRTKAGEFLTDGGSSDRIYRLRAGWAYQFRDLANGRRAILDVYLAGDVIGLDAGVCTRPGEKVQTLTAATVDAIPAAEVFEAMADRSTALYIAFLLCQRQRRAERHVAAISCLDAQGRLAVMLLDFYTRLRRRKLISSLSYNLPLSQSQIGNYLGLTVVHTNRVLRKFNNERIASLEKHAVTILDFDGLANLAEKGGAASARSISKLWEVNEAAD